MITEYINETLSKIELLVESKAYNGSVDEFYNLLETLSLHRPVRY